MNTIATALMPAASAAESSARTAARSGSFSTVPSARTRSSTSTTRS